MYINLDFISESFNDLNSKLKNRIPDSIRYTILISLLFAFIGGIYRTGLINKLLSLTRGNPSISIMIVIFLFLLFIKEIYYTGKNYSYIFEVLIIGFLLFMSVVFNKDKKYRSVFIYFLVVYILYSLGQRLKTNSVEELVTKYKLNNYDTLTYDILVVKDEEACRISGDYNENNNQNLTLELNDKYKNKKTCQTLVKDNNMNFIAKWDNILSFGGGKKDVKEDCDENWWKQVYNNDDELKNNTCLTGLTCYRSTCQPVKKKMDISDSI